MRQGHSARRRVIECHGGMQEGEGRVSKHAAPTENKEIITQCTTEVTALHFQGKTICI